MPLLYIVAMVAVGIGLVLSTVLAAVGVGLLLKKVFCG